ncbi:MAG: tetratricopeptide repeat protein [bacterium]
MAEPVRNGATPPAGSGPGSAVIDQYRALVASNPKDQYALHCLLMAFLSQKAHQEGMRDFQRLVAADQTNAKARLGLALLYEKSGHDFEAIREYNVAIELNPNEEIAYGLLTTRYLLKGEYDQALRVCRAGIERFPRAERLHFNLGYAYSLKQQYDEAIAAFTKEIEINPSCNEAYLNIDIMKRSKGLLRSKS